MCWRALCLIVSVDAQSYCLFWLYSRLRRSAAQLQRSTGSFLLCRVLQGTVSACVTVSRAIIRDVLPNPHAIRLLGQITTVMAIFSVLAPIIGGAAGDTLGWRAIFAALCVAGASTFCLAYTQLKKLGETAQIDQVGTASAYARLLRSKDFWTYSLCVSLSLGTFYVFLAGAPLIALVANLPSGTTVGAVIGSMTFGFAIGGMLSAGLSNRIHFTTIVLAGRGLSCLALCVGTILAIPEGEHLVLFIAAASLAGVGDGLTTPAATVGLLAPADDSSGLAAGLSGAITVAIGAALSAATTMIIESGDTAWSLLGCMLLPAALSLVVATAARTSASVQL